MKILALIPARGGSKGVPRKNLRRIGGKPLLSFTIKAALASKFINRIIVSSDDNKIISCAKRFGSETILRPPKFSSDKSSYLDVVRHSLNYLQARDGYVPDIVVYLQPTSPFRSAKDIDRIISSLKGGNIDSIFSVYEIDNSFLKSFRLNNKGFLSGAVNSKLPFLNRQALPKIYMPNGSIYAIWTNKFLSHNSFMTKKTKPFFMAGNKNIQIDTMDDLKKVRAIYRNRNW